MIHEKVTMNETVRVQLTKGTVPVEAKMTVEDLRRRVHEDIANSVVLLEQTQSIDANTFQPTVTSVIQLKYPIEVMQDAKVALTPDEFYMAVGKAVINCKPEEKQ